MRTINVVLDAALDYAKRIKLVGSNVCDDVELPGSKQYEVQVVLTPEQAQVLLLKVRGHYVEVFIVSFGVARSGFR